MKVAVATVPRAMATIRFRNAMFARERDVGERTLAAVEHARTVEALRESEARWRGLSQGMELERDAGRGVCDAALDAVVRAGNVTPQ